MIKGRSRLASSLKSLVITSCPTHPLVADKYCYTFVYIDCLKFERLYFGLGQKCQKLNFTAPLTPDLVSLRDPMEQGSDNPFPRPMEIQNQHSLPN
jgi:hypothetical protein